MLAIALSIWISMHAHVRTGMWVEPVTPNEPRYALPYEHVKRIGRI
jgi:hypothetical protein